MEREEGKRETSSRTAAACHLHCIVCFVFNRTPGEIGYAIFGQAATKPLR